MSKKKKKTEIQNAVFFLSSIIALVVGISFVGWAEKYSIVWRYSMFLNAPNEMVVGSLIVVSSTMIPVYKWIEKQMVTWKGNNPEIGMYVMLFLLGFPLLMCATQIGIIINGALDESQTQTFHTVVVSKRESHGVRGGMHYYIRVEDWYDLHQTVQVKVSHSNYETIQIGDSLDIKTKSGYLGYEWMIGPDLMKGKWPFDLPDN